ncbi:MAG: DMT family transporter [Desulfobacula sp.]|nr:DMT family transporter [Desulfobacula sp.]
MKSLALHKGIVQIHIAVFLFGFAGLFGKFLSCDPLYIVFGRTFFAAIALFVYARVAAKPPLSNFKIQQIFFFILQGILLAIHWWTFFVSIQLSSVAVGLVTFSTFPLFITFMEPFFFKERLKKRDIATAVAVFIGIILVIPELNFENDITKGAVYGILSGLTFALIALVNRKNAQACDSIAVAFYQNLFAAIFLIIPLTFLNTAPPGIVDLPNLIFLGVICTALSHTLFINALTHIRVQTASVIAGLEPVYGIILAFFMLNEIPELRTFIGGMIIIVTTIVAGFIGGKQKN